MRKLSILSVMLLILSSIFLGCSLEQSPFAPDTRISFAPVILPAGATLTSATLNVYISTPNNGEVTVHRVTAPWDEATVTHESFANAYDPTVIASFTADEFMWHSVDITTLFQQWSNGTASNFGILLDQPANSSPLAAYHSRELTSNHAYIEVCYELNGETFCEQTEVIGDTFITELGPTSNKGSVPVFYTGTPSPGLKARALLQFEVAAQLEQSGCTHTLRYWKRHTGFGPKEDLVTPLLPITIGNYTIDTRFKAIVVLKSGYGYFGSGLTKMMAQLFAAKLSIADGADDSEIISVIEEADQILAENHWISWYYMSSAEKQNIRNLKNTLSDYNHGYIGPGHCSEFEESHDYCGNEDGSHERGCDFYRGWRHFDSDDNDGGDND